MPSTELKQERCNKKLIQEEMAGAVTKTKQSLNRHDEWWILENEAER
jgi:hypothetical protein